MPIKNSTLDFSDMSGGKNSAYPRHAINRNQVVDSINVVHEKIGVSRAPGYLGLTTTALFDKPIDGHFTAKWNDGTETLINICNAKIYTIDVSAATKTEISAGALTVSGTCWSVNSCGKLWVVNGTDFIKIENAGGVVSAYRVGIATPTAGAAAAAAGGTLTAGVYGVYYSWARKNSDGQYLYSYPVGLGNVTLSGGNLSVALTGLTASADAQVTHKVVWLTDADGAVQYYYGEVVDSTTTITVTSSTNRNSAIRMDVNSTSNVPLAINPTGIYAYDDKLYVWAASGSTIYWSLKTDVNPFDMERFLSANFRTLSAAIGSVFNVGDDLFFNHIGNGVTKSISGDMSSVFKRIEKNIWFLPAKTKHGKSYVELFKGVAWGLTSDGFRYFDGEKFSEDLSFYIKPDIDRLVTDASTTYIPAMTIYRRSGKRTEMRISFRDTTISNSIHTSQLVFNLDFYVDPMASMKTWEYWETGFSEYALYNNILYMVQSKSDFGIICKESGVSDTYCFSKSGLFLSTKTTKQFYLLSRTIVDRLDAISIWGAVYTLATSSSDITGNVIVFDMSNTKFPFVFSGVASTLAVLPSAASGLGLALPFIMTAETPQGKKNKMPFSCSGNSVAIELTQTADDINLFIYNLQMPNVQQVFHNQT